MAQGETRESFREWVEAVHKLVMSKVGLSIYDLHSLELSREYETGVSPEEFWQSTVRGELEDLHFPIGLMEDLEAPIPWVDDLKAELEEPF